MTDKMLAANNGNVGGSVCDSEQSSSTKTAPKVTKDCVKTSGPLTMRRNGYELESKKGFRTAMLPSVTNPKVIQNTLQCSEQNTPETGVGSPCSGPVVVKQDTINNNESSNKTPNMDKIIVRTARETINNIKKIHAIKIEISKLLVNLFFLATEDG